MKYYSQIPLIILSALFALCFGWVLAKIIGTKITSSKMKDSIRKSNSDNAENGYNILSTGIIKKLMVYCNNMAVKLYYAPDTKRLTSKFVKYKKLSQKVEIIRKKSGITEMFNNIVYRECQARLALLFMVAGLLIGILFSNFLGIMLAFVGLVCGVLSPVYCMKKENDLRNERLEHDLPEMLEVIALGLRSGLTFDRSFQIYIDHFKSEFSYQCSLAINKWQNGISSREDSLKELACAYDSKLFSRTVEIIIRSLRFGTSAVENLEQAAADARAAYKTKQEEAVAKAPVKMMIPTGVLILPAMLLLVLGPVLLELSGGF